MIVPWKTTAAACATFAVSEELTVGETFAVSEELTVGETFAVGEGLTVGETFAVSEELTVGETFAVGEELTVDEALNRNTAVICIEKVCTAFPGIYTYINQQFCQFCVREWAGMTYINHGQGEPSRALLSRALILPDQAN